MSHSWYWFTAYYFLRFSFWKKCKSRFFTKNKGRELILHESSLAPSIFISSSWVRAVGDIQFLLWPWGVLGWLSLFQERTIPSTPSQCFWRWLRARAASASFSFPGSFWSSWKYTGNVAKHHLQRKKCQSPPVSSWHGSAMFAGFCFASLGEMLQMRRLS